MAVGIYFGLRGVLGTEVVSWLCILGAIPFVLIGFLLYNGMKAEQFLAAWIRSELLIPKKLAYRSTNLYAALNKENGRNV